MRDNNAMVPGNIPGKTQRKNYDEHSPPDLRGIATSGWRPCPEKMLNQVLNLNIGMHNTISWFTCSHCIGNISSFLKTFIIFTFAILGLYRTIAKCMPLSCLSKIVSQTNAEMGPSSEYGLLPIICLELLYSTGRIISFQDKWTIT